MTYTQKSVRTNGISLSYLEWGGVESAPTVLFLHPTGFHAHIWEPYAERLMGRFHCLAFDTRGHGDSEKPGRYGWTDYADDLEGALDALCIAGAIGIGHSAGATSIAVVAARTPKTFSRAVLIEPILFFGPGAMEQRPDASPPAEGSPMQAAARKRRMQFPNREAMLENYTSKPPMDTWDRSLLELYVRHGVTDQPDGSVMLKCSGEDEARMYAWGPRPLIAEEFLTKVTCPVLVISGDQSVALPPARARKAAALMPNSELLIVDDATHFVPFERPAETQAAIDRFIGGSR